MAPRDGLALLAVAIIWGLNFVAIKVGLGQFPPLLFSGLRFAIAALAVLLIPRPRIAAGYILLIGLFVGALQFAFLFWGIQAGVGAGVSSVLMQSQVFFTIGLYAVAFGERPRAAQLIGLALGVAGLVTIFFDAKTPSTTTGILLVLAGGLSWAVGNMFIRKSANADPLALSVWMSLVAAGVLLPASYILEGGPAIAAAIRAFNLTGALALLYIAGLATLLCYAIWGQMLTRYPAASVTPFALLVPVVGIASSILLLGETIGPQTLAGAGLIIAGLGIGVAGHRVRVWRR